MFILNTQEAIREIDIDNYIQEQEAQKYAAATSDIVKIKNYNHFKILNAIFFFCVIPVTFNFIFNGMIAIRKIEYDPMVFEAIKAIIDQKQLNINEKIELNDDDMLKIMIYFIKQNSCYYNVYNNSNNIMGKIINDTEEIIKLYNQGQITEITNPMYVKQPKSKNIITNLAIYKKIIISIIMSSTLYIISINIISLNIFDTLHIYDVIDIDTKQPIVLMVATIIFIIIAITIMIVILHFVIIVISFLFIIFLFQNNTVVDKKSILKSDIQIIIYNMIGILLAVIAIKIMTLLTKLFHKNNLQDMYNNYGIIRVLLIFLYVVFIVFYPVVLCYICYMLFLEWNIDKQKNSITPQLFLRIRRIKEKIQEYYIQQALQELENNNDD